MALGDVQQKEMYRPSVYGISAANPDAKYEKTSLSFSIWKRLLKVTISPKVNDDSLGYTKFDRENSVSIYLTPDRANVLHAILAEFKMMYSNNVNVEYSKGVATNLGAIVVSNGSTTEHKGIPSITIAIMGENGKVSKMYTYEIKIGNNFAVLDFNPKTGEYKTENDPYKYCEIDLILAQLQQYVYGATGGISATTVDSMSFELAKLQSSQYKIAEKLGVDLHSGGRYNTGTRTSYFNQGGNSGSGVQGAYKPSGTSSTVTIEELELE